MASEELEQRYPNGKGKKFGSFEVFECQLTTLRQFAEHGILPQIDFGPYKTQKCDSLIISRTPTIEAMVIGEHKAPGIITSTNREALALDLLQTKCQPTGAKIGYLTDGVTCIWLNGQAKNFVQILREDEKPMPLKVDFKNKDFATELTYIIQNLDTSTSIVRARENANPSKLAQAVWQTIWRLKADRPEDCLATFVELFLFKFLDDLGLLKTDYKGSSVSFASTLKLEKDKCYLYYEETIRPHIKILFPEGKDGFSIINGIILQGTNRDHNLIFHELLKKFDKFGSLTNVEPEFKTRLYESFLKESKTTTAFGQFFTPRKVVAAIHEMAKIKEMTPGKEICDPASGVGGFILEQMARDLYSQWNISGNSIRPIHKWHALEIVPKTATLAKANALVHCGELLADQPNRIKTFAKWLNEVFICNDKTALGSLEDMPTERYDLIITNPPFVVSGSADIGKLIKSDNERKRYFGQKYSGVEGLFIQYIVQALKRNGDAWILLPETFFLRTPDQNLRDWLLTNCAVDLLVILPERTFFNTPKRVVIVHMKRRVKALSAAALASQLKTEKILLFAVGEIGETRDAKRLPTETDLPLLVDTYFAHKGGREPDSSIRRATVTTADKLVGKATLNLRHFWKKEAAMEIGLLASTEDPVEAKRGLDIQMKNVHALADSWLAKSKTFVQPAKPVAWKTVSLGDHNLFALTIGRRVLKKNIYLKRTGVPLYSANIRKRFGLVDVANAGGLKNGGCLWSIDSDFDCRAVSPGENYSTTDHCGQLEILTSKIDPDYLARQIRQAGTDYGFNRDFRPSITIMQNLQIDLPTTITGDFDLGLMQAWTDFFDKIEQANDDLQQIMS